MSHPPSELGGVPFGASLQELKRQYPEVSRNPDSDRQFQVYQMSALKGVSAKSPAAFNIYKSRVVGGQILLDSYNARYWYDRMVERYGKPDSCSYCTDPELVSASWMWGNGVRLHIGGGMLTMLTEEGATQRNDWMSRGTSNASAENGDEESDIGEQPRRFAQKKSRRKAAAAPSMAPAAEPQPTGWSGYYHAAKNKVDHWMGWSK